MSDAHLPEAPKPLTPSINPHITRLPEITRRRRWLRRMLHWLARVVVRLAAKVEVRGVENVPAEGALLAVSNHLGDADVVIGMTFTPRPMEVFAKADLYTSPILGRLLDAYGVIWVHRGRPDRAAIRAGLQGLAEGRVVVIAPEGRESLSGALETGTQGAAYLAHKTGVRLLPVTFTGTENRVIYANLRRLRRSQITVTIGAPFRLSRQQSGQRDLAAATEEIMQTLAKQLPPGYRGVYQDKKITPEAGYDR